MREDVGDLVVGERERRHLPASLSDGLREVGAGRGPAEAARLLYREHGAEPARETPSDPPAAPQSKPRGRDRRLLAALKRGPEA